MTRVKSSPHDKGGRYTHEKTAQNEVGTLKVDCETPPEAND